MNKGSKCFAQTINLSNPRTCARPKPVRKLVGADVSEPCPSSGSGSTSWKPRPVQVKVCTRGDFKRTCPPKLCDCPQKGSKTAAAKLCNVMLFLLKGGVAAGLVYWTNAEGFWGTGAEAESLYYRVLSTVSPAMSNGADLNDLKLPHLESIKYTILQHYNNVVFHTTDGLVHLPIKAYQYIRNAVFPQNEEACSEKTEKADEQN